LVSRRSVPSSSLPTAIQAARIASDHNGSAA
jgi:hypothetical protein